MKKIFINGFEVTIGFYDRQTGQYVDELPPERLRELKARMWAGLEEILEDKLRKKEKTG